MNNAYKKCIIHICHSAVVDYAFFLVFIVIIIIVIIILF